MDIIEVIELSYSYPDGAEALRGVSLRVAEGRSLGLIGRNGAGKSTLLLHLNGIFGGSGAVRFRGTPIEELPAAQLRASVGLVFEDPSDQLFMPTVLDDVTFGPLNMGRGGAGAGGVGVGGGRASRRARASSFVGGSDASRRAGVGAGDEPGGAGAGRAGRRA
jgi:ABC-type branched-subunit amino acid transport system ATPase component